ncbi:hypothetical protein CXB51_024425 [Gossypium anomalum]|uniref:DUF7745 domain-containing protein n=1 Tax=Gossypium anomalum TaxID=47600 RepID=A0A8J5YCR1_9ROSI|nr:hypothetical protein CXB51_024425 [Gossypium anomalum]
MTVVVTHLSGSEKLRLREVFASVQDSGSLSGYIRTYGFGNADVHRWSEQTHLEKRDSITMGYVSELSDYTRISVTQNNLRELKEIWDQWGNETKRLFYDNYGDLPYLLDIQVNEHLFRALAQFWNPAYSCFTFGEVDLVPNVKEYTALLCCPRALGYVVEATTDLFHQFSKRVTSTPAILEETFRSLGACRKAVQAENYSPLKDIVASSRKVDVPEENWIALLQNLQSGDVEWRAPWMVPGEILYRCGSFDWVPLLGIWGAIGYAPLLVLRQHGLRHEFVYRGADYKRKVSEVSNTWNKTYQLKGVAIGPVTTLEYVEWRSRRINDNVPMTKIEETRPMEEYLQVIPSELDIIKQEFKRKNLELEKRIEKLEEEKMYLSLDVDLQKKEVEKVRKEKRKVEEDRDDLKEEYKKVQVSLRRVGLEKSSEQWQKEVQEEKARAEYWERKFQEMRA